MRELICILPVNRYGQVYLAAAPGQPPAVISDWDSTPENVLANHGFSAPPPRPILRAVNPDTSSLTVYLATGAEPGDNAAILPPLLLQTAVRMVNEGHITDLPTIAAILRAATGRLISSRIPVLYRDEYCAAVYKPSGMLVHRTSSDQEKDCCLLPLLRDQLGFRVQPVHRLDKPTSGVVLFTVGENSPDEFFRMFRERLVRKTYLAMVRGFTEDSGVIDYPIRRDKDNERRQEAVTRYETVARVELPIPVGPYPGARYSLIRAFPETGRMHQIRRHFAHLRHPIVGDTMYGDGHHNRMVREHFHCHRLMLAATGLEFVHPFTGKTVNIDVEPDTELDGSFVSVLRRIGLLTLSAENAPSTA